MKVYNLGCEHHHRFEGWFSSEEDFDKQSGSGQIQCPVCDSREIQRLPAAPRLNLSNPQPPEQDGHLQAVREQVGKLVQHLISNTEDVGERFAEEARRMHYNETPERAIRGVASANECAALVEEGIEVIALPTPVPPKTPIQ